MFCHDQRMIRLTKHFIGALEEKVPGNSTCDAMSIVGGIAIVSGTDGPHIYVGVTFAGAHSAALASGNMYYWIDEVGDLRMNGDYYYSPSGDEPMPGAMWCAEEV